MNDSAESGVILIVDDNPTNLEILVDILTHEGFQILVAEDGERAIQQATAALPDLILLDILMPGIDGFETCRRLKTSVATQSIPIIFLTALSDTDHKVKGFALGAVDYITKPLQYEEVLARVKTHVRLQLLTRQLQAQNIRLEQEIQERRQVEADLLQQTRRSQLFAEITLKIRQSLQLEEILQTAVTELRSAFQLDRALILRLLPQGNAKVVVEAVAPGCISVIDRNITDDCFGGNYLQKYRLGRIYSIADRDQATVEPCLIDFMHQFEIRAKLVVPILLKQELWGLLIAHQSTHPRQWTDFETELLLYLADQVGIALAQAQLLEQEIHQRQELTRSNAELQQFASIASHDLQEPLRMVTSYLQLLERRYQGRLDSDADEFIAYAVDGAMRMKILIEDLLTYSRVGTRGVLFQWVSGTAAVKQAIANLELTIEDSQAIITCEPLPDLFADPTQLTQLFQNLISNAIKFRSDKIPNIYIKAERQAEQWCISVQDNGIGIDPQFAERIFVIFQRLHSRAAYPGTGIGLAICKKIVERHGGRIWVDSTPGQGTTFYVTLPDRAADSEFK